MQEAINDLVDDFNEGEGKEAGITVNVTAIAPNSELAKNIQRLSESENPALPDIFIGYPDLAADLMERKCIVPFDEYLAPQELAAFIPAFLEEGRLSDGKIYVLPFAKSTELLFLNRTFYERFPGNGLYDLSTFEGLKDASIAYRKWSGDALFAADSPFNMAQIGVWQLGGTLIENGELCLESKEYEALFDILYEATAAGGFKAFSGFASELQRIGSAIVTAGSSAGINFYSNTIRLPDGTAARVSYDILPYPVLSEGTPTALQRGGGIILSESSKQKERAAISFIRWLTATEQNLRFSAATGYLPATKDAYERLPEAIPGIQSVWVKRTLSAVLDMHDRYSFFFAPLGASELERKYNEAYIAVFRDVAEGKLGRDEALKAMRDSC